MILLYYWMTRYFIPNVWAHLPVLFRSVTAVDTRDTILICSLCFSFKFYEKKYVRWDCIQGDSKDLNTFKNLLLSNCVSFGHLVWTGFYSYPQFFPDFVVWKLYAFLPPEGTSYWVIYFWKCSFLFESLCVFRVSYRIVVLILTFRNLASYI